MELYKKIGESAYRSLLSDPQGADVIAIPCEPGNGSVARGTLMYRKSSGLWAPAESGQVSTSYQLAVLNEDVETGDAVTDGAAAEDAAAYRAGRFIDGAVTLKAGGTVTEAHKLALRLEGIVFDRKEGTGTFHNESVNITYAANNGASPAEADVIVAEMYGATHTVLGNSGTGGTGFTAPSGKTFSKWNTKADGSGTDYAAAASYTANAPLTLYAVWAS